MIRPHGAPPAVWAGRSLLALQAVLVTLAGAELLLLFAGLHAIGCGDSPSTCNVIGFWVFVVVIVLHFTVAWSMAVMPWIKRRWIPAAICTGEGVLLAELIASTLYIYVPQPANPLYSPPTQSGNVWIQALVLLLPIAIISTALVPTARRFYRGIWNGSAWQSSLSPDGRWRWDGTTWQPSGTALPPTPRLPQEPTIAARAGDAPPLRAPTAPSRSRPTNVGILAAVAVVVVLAFVVLALRTQPPLTKMTLTTSASALLTGGTATITATLKDGVGNPVPNEQVSFSTSGSAPVTLSARQATTNSSGVATTAATSASEGFAEVSAITNGNATGSAVGVEWSSSVVTGLSPNHGPSAGGTSVTLTGGGFTSAATVYFGSAQAASTTFVNASTLAAVTPPGEGAVDARVGVNGSFSSLTSSDVYTYGPLTITSISPTSGPATGGTSVKISGTNFAPGAQVKFGSVLSPSILVSSTTSITAVSPLSAAGTVDVTVTTNGGASATSPADRFTFVGSGPTGSGVQPLEILAVASSRSRSGSAAEKLTDPNGLAMTAFYCRWPQS